MVGRENDLYAGEVNELMKRSRAYKMSGLFYACIDEVIFQLANGFGWALVILKVLNYEATIGSLTAFLGLWSAMMEPILYFKSFITDSVEELSNMVRLKKLMDENPRIQDGRECLRLTNGQVRLENVSFAYSEFDEASLIVGNLSLIIEGGTKVAFVGANGKLCARKDPPTRRQSRAHVSRNSQWLAIDMGFKSVGFGLDEEFVIPIVPVFWSR
jgi:ABC-type multidrug transport system fused ATPase/permease subunit